MVLGDARDRSVVSQALAGADEVVYCVGGLQPGSAERDPRLDAALTLEPLRALLTTLRAYSGTRLTLISSGGAVYGNPERSPTNEETVARPIGAYGSIRLQAEELVGATSWLTNPTILRCSNVYGEFQPLNRGQGAVGVFIDRISRSLPIEVFGHGAVVRDYVYAGDLATVVAGLLSLEWRPAIVNLGSGTGTSTVELVEIVEEALGRRAVVVSRPHRVFDVHEIVLDITLLRSLVPFKPLPLRAGIARLAASCAGPSAVPAGGPVAVA